MNEKNVFVEIINQIPKELILTGKKLFDVIGIVHKGIDAEVERVKELKKIYHESSL